LKLNLFHLTTIYFKNNLFQTEIWKYRLQKKSKCRQRRVFENPPCLPWLCWSFMTLLENLLQRLAGSVPAQHTYIVGQRMYTSAMSHYNDEFAESTTCTRWDYKPLWATLTFSFCWIKWQEEVVDSSTIMFIFLILVLPLLDFIWWLRLITSILKFLLY
jgi:hypothetical protein